LIFGIKKRRADQYRPAYPLVASQQLIQTTNLSFRRNATPITLLGAVRRKPGTGYKLNWLLTLTLEVYWRRKRNAANLTRIREYAIKLILEKKTNQR
jgi:hypothetical protein